MFPLARCPKSHHPQQQQHSIACLPQLTNFLWFHRRVSQHSCHRCVLCTNLFSKALQEKTGSQSWLVLIYARINKERENHKLSLNYPSWPKVDCCTGGVIQTVVIAPSMGAYSTLQECELPQSVHFFSSVNKNFQRSTIKILNQSPQSLLSPSCARFCSDCSPNQQGDLLMPACSDVSNGEQSGVKVLTLLSHPFLGHYLETGGCCAAILISRALLLFDM